MKARLIKKEPTAKDIYTYYFKVDNFPKYTAGQFIEMTIKHDNPDDRGIKHWFTISAPPGQDYITITTRYIAGQSSSFKAALNRLTEYDEIDISDPMGDFVLPIKQDLPLMFVAGGIGITPFLSILGSLVGSDQKRTIGLLYSVKDKAEAVNIVRFKTLLKFYQLQVTSQDKILTADDILETSKKLGTPLLYISGPEKMVESISNNLEALGVDKDRIVGDFFPGYDN